MLWVVLFYIVNYVKHVKYCTVLRVINLSESLFTDSILKFFCEFRKISWQHPVMLADLSKP